MFETLIEEMKLHNFSPKTRSIYLHYNQTFLHFIRKYPKEVSGADIRHYLLYLINKHHSSSTINLAHNALNFYYGKILRKNVDEIPFQKRESKIKEIASPEEIQKLIDVTPNPKHKLVISLLYASGVRRSELVTIRIEDLDLNKRLLLIKAGKGNKDRFTILSHTVIQQIKDYLRTRPYPSPYLFASHQSHITPTTVERIIEHARQKAKIEKNITPHTLRHSFATHHLEVGTRLEYIQQMLGHRDIRTTRAYQNIVTKHLETITSPQDIKPEHQML